VIQFKAIGSYERAGTHPVLLKDITLQAAWLSSNPGVATINTSGLATANNNGTTTISATIGAIVGTATLEFLPLPTARSLTSLTIVPGKRATSYVGRFTQLMAIGMYNTEPRVQDVTNEVQWQSSNARITSVDSKGLAMGSDLGPATITATAKSQAGGIITASTVLTQQPETDGAASRTVTVFDAGVGSGTIVSDPPGIECTSGNGCSANFAIGATVTLTATPAPGSSFGGWSSNCLPSSAATCSVIIRNNEPIGVIFH
jgi:Bacterial Ig-like domain (group 2)/Divergent InlB B-repeat domain